MVTQEYVRRDGVWHVKERGLLHVVPKEQVPQEVRDAEARARAAAPPPAPPPPPRAERPASILTGCDVARVEHLVYASLIEECYVRGSRPRVFRADGVEMSARAFALFVGVNLLLLPLEDWRRWYHTVYHRNNDVLVERGYRLEEYREREPRGNGTGSAQYAPPTPQELSLAASWAHQPAAA
jgi:hypothetical protein